MDNVDSKVNSLLRFQNVLKLNGSIVNTALTTRSSHTLRSEASAWPGYRQVCIITALFVTVMLARTPRKRAIAEVRMPLAALGVL